MVLCKAIAIVPAAGSGQRMGLPQSKLLCPLRGRPVLSRTLLTLADSGFFETIVVPCRAVDRVGFKKLADEIEATCDFIEGGMTRAESVQLALAHIQKTVSDCENRLIAVHDAARCLLSAELLSRCMQAGEQFGAVAPALPVVDTVYHCDLEHFLTLPLLERASLRAMQTPQVFKFSLLWHAHQDQTSGGTDDAGMVAKFHRVKLVEGESTNIKITSFNDLAVAENLLSKS